ncbi:MAG TPA: hypothetical protein VF133_00785 [Terriglobales bacterium]
MAARVTSGGGVRSITAGFRHREAALSRHQRNHRRGHPGPYQDKGQGEEMAQAPYQRIPAWKSVAHERHIMDNEVKSL